MVVNFLIFRKKKKRYQNQSPLISDLFRFYCYTNKLIIYVKFLSNIEFILQKKKLKEINFFSSFLQLSFRK